jgi:hypothetical protein
MAGLYADTTLQQRPTDEQIERGLTDALAAIKAL